MAIYTVLAPPARDGEAAPDPLKTVFVKDGFSWPALFFAAPWMIYRRMWLTLVVYVAVMAALGYVMQRAGGDFGASVVLLVHLLFALEANNLRRWTLERRGFRLVAVAEGRNIEEAEIRYFSSREASDTPPPVPPIPAPPPAPTSIPTPPVPPIPPVQSGLRPMQPSAEAGDVVGLFPTPATTPGGRSS
jgi:hypothetical protein